jgi:aryl-alcohol dehydrogenase-like predicted oxidoreductase
MGIKTADMVQFHWWSLSKDGSSKTFLKAGRALSKLKEQGKIHHLAGCNMDTTNLKMLVDDGMAVEANQVQYSLLDRRAEVRLLEYCKESGIKLLVFGVVAGGLLSEKFLGVSQSAAQGMLDSVSRRMYWSSLQRWSRDWSLFQDLLKVLKSVGEKHVLPQGPATIAMVASVWALQRLENLGSGGSLILGVRDARHIDEHTALLSGLLRLDNQEMLDIQQVLDRGAAPRGDIWYEERGWA